MSNADVVNDPAFKQLGSDVAFYFANQRAPRVAQSLGEAVGKKIAKTRGESDEQWCREAAIGALTELRDQAVTRGGNAVINIHSSYNGNQIADQTKYECHAGGTGGHVGLQGTIVKLVK
ncbi:MAG: excinuclease ATPase subunit [Candidatus Binataceae bacterium]